MTFRCTLCKEPLGVCDCPPWENARFECDECGERLEACQCMVDPIDGSMVSADEEE